MTSSGTPSELLARLELLALDEPPATPEDPLENELLEDELLRDELLRDELLKDELLEGELLEGELPKDTVPGALLLKRSVKRTP